MAMLQIEKNSEIVFANLIESGVNAFWMEWNERALRVYTHRMHEFAVR